MTLLNRSIWITFVLAGFLLVTAEAAQARHWSRGVYMVNGSNTYYFIDDDGYRHVIQRPEIVRTKYFRDEPVVTVTSQEIDALPTGEVITESVGPEKVVKKKTVIHSDGTKTETIKTEER
jgi:hypothetical protein